MGRVDQTMRSMHLGKDCSMVACMPIDKVVIIPLVSAVGVVPVQQR